MYKLLHDGTGVLTQRANHLSLDRLAGQAWLEVDPIGCTAMVSTSNHSTHDVINIARPFLVEGGPGRLNSDVFMTIDIIVIVVMQVSCKKRVIPVLQQLLNRLACHSG